MHGAQGVGGLVNVRRDGRVYWNTYFFKNLLYWNGGREAEGVGSNNVSKLLK